MISAQEWLRRLGGLNVSRSKAKGPAPNKPLLVLAIMDWVEEGLAGQGGVVKKDAHLQLRFRNYTPICAPRRGNKIDLDLPWEYLASDGLYQHPQGRVGDTVKLDQALFGLLMQPDFRMAARKVLIATYFPPDEQVALFAACDMTPPSNADIAQVREDQAVYKTQLRRGRCARFASQVVSGHRFTCALTGYRLTTATGFNLLEAAHIKPHAQHGPDTPDNGLALTPTAHALFDAHLWSISPDLRIVVARDAFEESSVSLESLASSSSAFSLKSLHGKPLHLPGPLRPNPTYLSHHLHYLKGA